MEVREAIQKRRAYRSLDPVDITEDLIRDLAGCAQLSASCFNNQPWRFVFVYDPDMLKKMLKERVYHQFDTGMATAFLILRATELELVAHPIAGYSPKKTREVLGIPEDLEVITLVIIGKHAVTIKPILSEKQVKDEKTRPERFTLKKFVYLNRFTNL